LIGFGSGSGIHEYHREKGGKGAKPGESKKKSDIQQLKYGGGHPAPLDRSWALRRPIQSAFRGLFTPLNIHPNTKSAFVQSAVKALFYNVA
jgi:hypothetical protein